MHTVCVMKGGLMFMQCVCVCGGGIKDSHLVSICMTATMVKEELMPMHHRVSKPTKSSIKSSM